jgi:hypothetical protein
MGQGKWRGIALAVGSAVVVSACGGSVGPVSSAASTTAQPTLSSAALFFATKAHALCLANNRAVLTIQAGAATHRTTRLNAGRAVMVVQSKMVAGLTKLAPPPALTDSWHQYLTLLAKAQSFNRAALRAVLRGDRAAVDRNDALGSRAGDEAEVRLRPAMNTDPAIASLLSVC